MDPHRLRLAFTFVGVLWVGGWGFLMFRYPEFFVRWNKRFGMGWMISPKYVRFVRGVGIVEMILAGLSAINALVLTMLRVSWF